MANLIKREIEDSIKAWLDSKEIIAIRGTRQSGKTTFLNQLIEILKEKGVDKKRIHFITFEDDFEKEKFEKNPKDYINYYIGEDKEKHFFLLDEVQYVKMAGKLLKLVYDTISNIKIIITGSSTLDINQIGSFLVGRVLLFEMYPFSFSEFLKSKDEKLFGYYANKKVDIKKKIWRKNEIIFIEELNKYLKGYLTFGGYPAVVLENDSEKKKFLLKNIFLTYVEKDIVKVYGIKYKQKVLDLIKYLASINSAILNYNEICTVTGLYNKEVREIISVLEDTYIIRLLKPFHKNLTTELRKNPKVYFIDTGLRNFITGRFDFGEDEYGKLLENYIANKFREEKINYWRTTAKAEIDFVISEKTPVEVKLNPKITRAIRSFIDTYNPKKAVIISLKEYKKAKIKRTEILIVPASLI